ncbi:MAG TPA: response regulator [Desulfovibrio sp.]|jgi:CheY-like chemotaxis protein|nr:response regulator [Desulfovibrio sp.]HBR06130.1 response regulator [Desulfovibrio sp.]
MAKILIAEDDRISQKFAAGLVENEGHTAFVSPNGRHAYEALKVNSFDLLLTDIMMPEMDGRQLILALRGDAALRRMPVIIMSAVVGVGEIAELLKTGATFFLAKPLSAEDLREYLRRGLNAPGSAQRS